MHKEELRDGDWPLSPCSAPPKSCNSCMPMGPMATRCLGAQDAWRGKMSPHQRCRPEMSPRQREKQASGCFFISLSPGGGGATNRKGQSNVTQTGHCLLPLRPRDHEPLCIILYVPVATRAQDRQMSPQACENLIYSRAWRREQKS